MRFGRELGIARSHRLHETQDDKTMSVRRAAEGKNWKSYFKKQKKSLQEKVITTVLAAVYLLEVIMIRVGMGTPSVGHVCILYDEV